MQGSVQISGFNRRALNRVLSKGMIDTYTRAATYVNEAQQLATTK